MVGQRNATGCYSRIGRKFLCGKSGGPPVTLSAFAGVWLGGCKIPDDLPESQQRMICHSDWMFGCSSCSNRWRAPVQGSKIAILSPGDVRSMRDLGLAPILARYQQRTKKIRPYKNPNGRRLSAVAEHHFGSGPSSLDASQRDGWQPHAVDRYDSHTHSLTDLAPMQATESFLH
ncbi:hypothetical protein AFLA_009371 [Aspergillus flavus NRRL3357]|nr:hypothetical protein AFLA_009371 [Aspergillus flavus NRRL3357]